MPVAANYFVEFPPSFFFTVIRTDFPPLTQLIHVLTELGRKIA